MRSRSLSCALFLAVIGVPAAFFACGSSDAAPTAPGPAASSSAPAASSSAPASVLTAPVYAPGDRPAAVTFPSAFLWGAASAPEQVEKGLDATDWHDWAELTGKVSHGDKPDDGPDAFSHIQDDVQAMKDSGLDAYRFGIEMARLYPTRAAFDADTPDPDAIAKYQSLLDALQAANITPIVTLHHFSFPTWLSDVSAPGDPQGWERSDATQVFTEFAKRIATRWGSRIDWWVTINEPGVHASVGWLAGIWPPGVGDIERMATAMRVQVRAHAAAYDAIHAADTIDADGDGTAAWVSMAFHNRVYDPLDATNPDDVAAVAHANYFWNFWYLNAVTAGDFDFDFDGKVDGANDVTHDPTLVRRLDYIGLNYYGHSIINSAALSFNYMGILPAQSNLGTMDPKQSLGWDIHPIGFGEVIDQLRPYGLPYVITENGVAAAPDEPTRARFIAEHLFELGWAMQRGADVRGYTYWALTDNFEWASGFCPTFGLYSVDHTTPARTRTPSNGQTELRDIIAAKSISQSDIDALPAYPTKPAVICH